MQPYTIGIDLGTGSCKSLVVGEQGQLLGMGASSYPAGDMHSRFEEQDPQGLLQAVYASTRAALEQAGVEPFACQGASVGGALHSLLALDAQDRPLTGVITWADNRAAAQAHHLARKQDMTAHYQATGCPNHALYPFTKILWLRQEQPKLFARAVWFISAKEYVTLRLTGVRMVDYSIAGGTGLLNTHTLQWDAPSLDLLGITPARLFPLAGPRTRVGTLLPDAAQSMGLAPGVPLYLGSSDAVNSSLGAGCLRPDQMTCMVGTSGAIRIIASRPLLDPQQRLWCYAIDPEHWLVGGAINNGGLALQWLHHLLEQMASGSTAPDIDQILAWAAEVEPGADGVLCLPLFTAERSPDWNSDVKGVFYGLTLEHDQRHMARALLEGVSYRLKSVFAPLAELAGPFAEVRASGGFAGSPVWLQIVTDILGVPLSLVASKETSGLAAAYWAMLGSGMVTDFTLLERITQITAQVQPGPASQAVYPREYARYSALYAALLPIFAKDAAA